MNDRGSIKRKYSSLPTGSAAFKISNLLQLELVQAAATQLIYLPLMQ